MKAFVYFNLRKRCWSVRVGGKVVAHASYVQIDNATLTVSEAGRQRVLRQGRKNVHAGVRGTLFAVGSDTDWLVSYQCIAGHYYVDSLGLDVIAATAFSRNVALHSHAQWGTKISYNPYKASTFVAADGHPVHTAGSVVLHAAGNGAPPRALARHISGILHNVRGGAATPEKYLNDQGRVEYI